jgi:hypothetical protein
MIAFYNRLKDKVKNGKVIVCAIMRKLVHVIFGVLKSSKNTIQIISQLLLDKNGIYKSTAAGSGENQILPFVLKYLTDVWFACFMDDPFVILQFALPNATCIFEIISILLRLPTSSTISIYGTSNP